MEEFPSYEIFNREDRKEFIFQIFKSICLGGRVCQYEDSIHAYLETTKKLYKDLVRYFIFTNKSVVKDSSTQKLKVVSMVFKINSVLSSISPLFPVEHPQNFCFVSIDPVKRRATVYYHGSDAYY